MKGLQFSRKFQGIALLIALAGGATGYALARVTPSVGAARVHATFKTADASEAVSSIGFAPIVKQVLPNVVNISSSKVVRTPNQFTEGMPADPFFQRFFGKGFGFGPEIP